jgi:hypothetical protein
MPGKIPVATVQVDPEVMVTPYGSFIRGQPKVILQALSMSVELGVLVTITPRKKCLFLGCQHPRAPGTIVYIGTNNDGRSEILHYDTN